VTDANLREAIVATGLPWRLRDYGTGIEMLLIPPGTFHMGCITGSDQYGCDSTERPVHEVTLTSAFYLGRFEVTQAQWQAQTGSNPSLFQGQLDSARRPVEQVSWSSVNFYLSATGMRLPTEAEWEYACRAGTQTPFYNGSTDDGTVGTLAWFYYNTCEVGSGCGTRPVGGKLANVFGFHDMLGNVFEWVNDRYSGYTADPQTNPTGPASGSIFVLRGGCWENDAYGMRSSYRSTGSGFYSDDSVGFRAARTP